jgi:hypothetical protein
MTFGDEWGWGSPKAEAQKVYETYRRAGEHFIDDEGDERRFLAWSPLGRGILSGKYHSEVRPMRADEK